MTARTTTIRRPAYVWLAVALQVACAAAAIPVGIMFITDPTGAAIQMPAGWIEATPFGSYLIPGLYLFAVNGLGMLLSAGLAVRRHPVAPWLMGALGIGLMIWIAVQVAIMPETMILQPILFVAGLVMGVVALLWILDLRREAARS